MSSKMSNSLVGLSDNIRILSFSKGDGYLKLFIEAKNPVHRCPACGSAYCNVRSSKRLRTVQHLPACNMPTLLRFYAVPLKCMDCGQSFTYSPIEARARITRALYLRIYFDLCNNMPINLIAASQRTTEKIVRDVLNSIDTPRPSRLPETLSIDEFKGDSGEYDSEKKKWIKQKYLCSVADGSCGAVIDVLPKIHADYLIDYFLQFSPEERRAVQYYTCDMHNGFIKVAKHCFPHAHICIDLFHVVKLMNDRLDQVRIREQNRLLDPQA